MKSMRTFVLLIACLLVVSCLDGPEERVTFRKPLASNGIKVQDGLLYFTDLLGQSITGIKPEDGTMVEQYDFFPIRTGVDDLVFMDDGTIYWTSPLEGTFGSIIDGEIEVLAQPGSTVNPIERRPGTDLVYFGFEAEGSAIGRIDHSTGAVDYDVVTGLPSINGFSFAEDGYLYAPLFSMEAILSNEDAGVLRIDVDNNTFELLDVDFPDEPTKRVFKATTGVVADGNGTLYVLEAFPPMIYKLDLEDLTAVMIRGTGSVAADNIAISPEKDLLYITSFNEAKIWEMAVDGSSLRKIIPKK